MPESPRPRVLVVDDEEDARVLYADWLGRGGFVVEVAVNGAEAVAKASALAPHAIIMDLQMPVMDGWEATRQIRAALGARPYILALTAHTESSSRREAYDAGCDDLVGKPLTPDLLVTIVRAALRPPDDGEPLRRSTRGAGRCADSGEWFPRTR